MRPSAKLSEATNCCMICASRKSEEVPSTASVSASLGKPPGVVGGSSGASPGVSAALQKPPGMGGTLLGSSYSATPSSSLGNAPLGGGSVQSTAASLGKAPGPGMVGGSLGASPGVSAALQKPAGMGGSLLGSSPSAMPSSSLGSDRSLSVILGSDEQKRAEVATSKSNAFFYTEQHTADVTSDEAVLTLVF